LFKAEVIHIFSMPDFAGLMMDDPGKDWGKPCYPVVA
jgi:hypothetical protein